jgi:four helix bundle protein
MLEKFQAYQVAKSFYRKCKILKLPDFLHRQLLRASSSIALNLLEGSGKRTTADRKRYFRNALGSINECRGILDLEDAGNKEMRELLERLGAMTYNLCRSDQRPPNTPPV